MTWKIELTALAFTAACVGGFVYQADLLAEEPINYHAAFTEADYNAFDRDFAFGEETCGVGLEDFKICMRDFKSNSPVKVGAKLPSDLPALSVRMRTLLVLDSKQPNLKTVRFGNTLVLIEAETDIVRDILRLSAPTYEDARKPALIGSPVGVAAN